MFFVGRINIKRKPPPPPRGDHAIAIRIDTCTKDAALKRISAMNPEILRGGGKALTLGAYTKRALTEYPSLRDAFLRHQTLVRKLMVLREALRLVDPLGRNAQGDLSEAQRAHTVSLMQFTSVIGELEDLLAQESPTSA